MQNLVLSARGLGRFIPGRAKAGTKNAKAITKRNRLAFAIGSVLTLAGSYFGLIKPENSRLQETKVLAEQAEATVSQLRAELARLRNLEKKAGEMEEQARRLNEALPVETHLAKFILQVQEASDQAKLDWVSASPAPPVASGAAPGLMESTVGMTAEGTYAAVQDFLGRLENLARAVKIGSVNITLLGESTADPGARLNAVINLKMFVAPTAPPLPSEPAPAAGGPAPPASAPPTAPAAPAAPAAAGGG